MSDILDLTIELPGMDEAQENLDKPRIAEGTYLAVVGNVEKKIGTDPKFQRGITCFSVGLNWSLSVNIPTLNNVKEGWVAAGPFVEQNYVYTHLGYYGDVDGSGVLKVFPGEKGWSIAATGALRALNTTKFDPADHIGRIVQITIVHEKPFNSTDPNDTRRFPAVKSWAKYTNDAGEVAPKLAGFEPKAAATAPEATNDNPF